MKDHVPQLAGLVALAMLLGGVTLMAFHGIKEDALLIILLSAAAEVAKAIVGIQPKTGSTAPTPPVVGDPNQAPTQQGVTK